MSAAPLFAGSSAARVAQAKSGPTRSTPQKLYRELCRPKTARSLQALRLDVVYERAVGDHLYFRKPSGELVQVTDFVGGFGALMLGHNHPELRRVAREVLESDRPFAAQASCRAGAAKLAETLNEVMRPRVGEDCAVLLANSGAEAVEAALKHAALAFDAWHTAERRKLQATLRRIVRGVREERYRLSAQYNDTPIERLRDQLLARFDEIWNHQPLEFMALEGAFHGKTTGALGLTHHARYRAPFERLLPSTRFVPPDDTDALRAAVNETLVDYPWMDVASDGVVRIATRRHTSVGALFAEPIQGEGGVRVIGPEFLRVCRELADEHGFALVFDEIQTGMGRTGAFLCSEHAGVVGDYYLLSKSLGGGLAKISALVVRRSQYQAELSAVHTSTFAEDDFASAVATRAVEMVCEPGGGIERAATRGRRLLDALTDLGSRSDVIDEVRGVGLMVGIELAGENSYGAGAIRAMASQGLLGYVVAGYLLHRHNIRLLPCISNPMVLRIEPSSFISELEIHKLVQALDRLCEALEKNNAFELMSYIVAAGSSTETPIPTERAGAEIADFTAPPVVLQRADVPRRVAVLGYFVDADQIARWDPSLELLSPKRREELVRALFLEVDPVLVERGLVHSATGEGIEMLYYGLFADAKTLSANLRGKHRAELRDKIQVCVDMAREEGCQLFGLGGLTSVLTTNGRDVATGEIGITTGNSLTVAMCLDALERECAARGIALGDATLGAVGAAGNIGSIYCQIIAKQVSRLVLISRPGCEAMLRPLVQKLVARALRQIDDGQPSGGGTFARRAPSRPIDSAMRCLGRRAPNEARELADERR